MEAEIRRSRRVMLDKELVHAEELGRLYVEELSRAGTPGHQGRLQQRRQALLSWIQFTRGLMPDVPVTATDLESHRWGKVLDARAQELVRGRRREPPRDD